MRSSYLLVLGALVAPLAGVASLASCHFSDQPLTTSGAGGASASATSTGGASPVTSSGTGLVDSGRTDAPVVDAGSGPCSLPGSVQFTSEGIAIVPGGHANDPDLTFLHLPVGFCAHHFTTVNNARQLRFAPGGELFVASPTTVTTGGGSGGLAAIVVVPDDDKDGYGDSNNILFAKNLPSTQGLLFANDSFYYQDDTVINRVPYAPGQRKLIGTPTQVTNITYYTSSLHWPKVLDMADDGTLYVGNGGDQGEACDTSRPAHGAVVKVQANGHATPVAIGLRNPIAIRCTHGSLAQCFGIELAKDYSDPEGGREKMFPIRDGDDWGFPCCATKNQPYQGVGQIDCSSTASESEAFFIGDTPFGLAFESAGWPAPWGGRAYVTLHGAAGSWTGTRLVSVEMDARTGRPVAGSDVRHPSAGGMTDFATGWDDNTYSHGRPAAVEFSSDGRLFVGSDANGVIFWIAPIQP